MNDLIDALRRFQACYPDDPAGFADDFAIVTGHSLEELTQLLNDEASDAEQINDEDEEEA